MKEYKTDISDVEVSKAALNLIKNYKSSFYEIKYENNVEIVETTERCLYCDSKAEFNYKIKTNFLLIGSFCSKLCRSIYYSIISSIFNLPVIEIINFIPYTLLSLESKNKYQDIKVKISNTKYKYLNFLTKYENDNLYSDIKLIISENEFLKFNNLHFKYITTNTICFYCHYPVINSDLILDTKYGIIKGFCSQICKDSISKQIYRSLIPKFKYISYIFPFELFENKEEISRIIDKLRNETNLYGGISSYFYKYIKLEFFTIQC